MTPELWQRLKPLYQAAIQRPKAQRAGFIAEACGNDDELRRELVALLKANDEQTASRAVPNANLGELIVRTPPAFSVGEVILGRFKIVRPLGSGGMGDVYETLDLELGRIALKTIRFEIADSPETLSRFKKEVQLARKVSGPNVCRVHELFVLSDDQNELPSLFLTMEFLDGVTLADKIRESGPVHWREAQAIMTEICAGLQAIHQVGIIHRDLKSRNVMLAERNGATCAVLTDFGLAREFKSPSSETMSYVTTPGVIAGTPAYMAPEQFEGTELSPATDIYALGVVLYELVTGKHPFAASTAVGTAVLRGRREAWVRLENAKLRRNLLLLFFGSLNILGPLRITGPILQGQILSWGGRSLQLMAETNINYATRNEFRLVVGLGALIIAGRFSPVSRTNVS